MLDTSVGVQTDPAPRGLPQHDEKLVAGLGSAGCGEQVEVRFLRCCGALCDQIRGRIIIRLMDKLDAEMGLG